MFSAACAKKKGFQGLLIFACVVFTTGNAFSQNDPGIDGMAPKKWITVRHTQAPGRIYRSTNTNDQVCTQEDFYIKIWMPLVHTQKFTLAFGPQYRTEQLEFENQESPAHALSHWNLRYIGADLRSIVAVNTSSWLMFNVNGNKSGNFGDYRFNRYSFNYTFSGAYLKKESNNTEYGAGLLINKSFAGITVLPILIYHHNISNKMGVEVSLPYKAAWRYNISPSDILFVKGESLNRDYMIRTQDAQCSFRSINVDMGIAYNKAFSKLLGAEAFVGYRQNLSNRLPENVVAVKKSGMAFSLEIYVRPPQKKAQ